MEQKQKDSEDGPAHPNIIYEEPDDKASSSDKDVSDATLPTIVFFACSAVRASYKAAPLIEKSRILNDRYEKEALKHWKKAGRSTTLLKVN
ncbi:hypothetical protein Tco_0458545 [Tanacetum coccineum]